MAELAFFAVQIVIITIALVVPDLFRRMLQPFGLMLLLFRIIFIMHLLTTQPYLEKNCSGISTNQTELKPAAIFRVRSYEFTHSCSARYAEQSRIVKKLSEVLPLVMVYNDKETALETYNNDFPSQLKKSILQYAVQGKLVPQDPTDESASALLERIRAEKEQLIKSGKIKRDKHESVIFRRDNSYYERVDGIERCIDDEIPFEIPENWEVVRLQNIGEYRKGPFGSSLTKSMFVPKSKSSIKVYEQKNAIQKDCTLGTYYIPMEYYNEKMKGFTVLPNDIIVSCAGTIGETYILPSSAEIGIINQALMRMRITSQINVDYFLIYFDYVVKETARESSKGSAIKNIPPFDIFKKIILPLPPLKEQKRIVQEVQIQVSHHSL